MQDFNATMERLIACNNQGARCIERGDFPNAIRHLSFGIKTYKRTWRKLQPKKSSADAAVTSIDIDEIMRKMPNDPTDEISMYYYPVFFPEMDTSSNDVAGLFVTTITFNLALSNHLYAIQSGNKLCFRAAARLYKHGFHLERQRGDYSVSPFFLMATLNNLGLLYQVTKQKDRSERCFRQLLATLMYVVLSKGAQPSDLERYFGNTSISLFNRHKKCAAAA